ncbi:MAG TPA: FHA domain-containing protein, partial [Nannocystis sp.]
MANVPLVLTCAGRRIGVGVDQFSIGRTRDNDLPIRNANVSRRHCRIERRADGFYIVDAGSTTGIELRGCKIAEYKIEDGDVFVLNEEVSVRCSMSPAPLAELHTPTLRVITVEPGPLGIAGQANDIRYREPLPFEVRGVLLAGPKGAAVFWRDEAIGRSGLARGSDSFSWSTAAFPLLRADAAPDGITLR